MPKTFPEMLSGGHHTSLGRTPEVVEIVLSDDTRLPELFDCLNESDDLVRMRAGDALEKVCRERPEWFARRVDRIIDGVGAIEQPSVQWHTAQMLDHLQPELSPVQYRRGVALVKSYLTGSQDWIVLNVTMEILAGWSGNDAGIAEWLPAELDRLSGDSRKSVAKRSAKLRARFTGE